MNVYDGKLRKRATEYLVTHAASSSYGDTNNGWYAEYKGKSLFRDRWDELVNALIEIMFKESNYET